MASIWKRLFRKTQNSTVSLMLLGYAENYLTVFEVGSQSEKTRHAEQLFDAANSTAQQVGARDFLSLIKSADVDRLARAAIYSRQSFDEMFARKEERYWSSTFAVTHFMILNSVKSLDDTPRARLVATNAAHLYAAEYARRQISSSY